MKHIPVAAEDLGFSAFSLALVALLVGAVTTAAPALAAGIAVLPILVWVIGRYGGIGLAAMAVGALPWLVVFGSLLPHLMKTFSAAAAALVFLIAADPRGHAGRAWLWVRLGSVLMLIPIAISIMSGATNGQLIEASKYMVFPAMAIAITGATRSDRLATIGRVALWSGVLAVLAQLFIAVAGLGSVGATYGSGEHIGFAEAPHDVSLLASAVAAGIVAAPLPLWRKAPLVAAAATVALFTGVRTGIVGLVLVGILWMIVSRLNVRVIAVVAIAAIAVFATGADNVVLNRLHHSQQTREFSSIATAGSGRGAIYQTALRHYRDSAASQWIVGTGLRSVGKFTQADLGESVTGQSDFVTVLVELGLIGIVGLVVIWVVLATQVSTRLPLLPVLAFAILNGSLEYLAPLVVALSIASSLGVTVRRSVTAVDRATSRWAGYSGLGDPQHG